MSGDSRPENAPWIFPNGASCAASSLTRLSKCAEHHCSAPTHSQIEKKPIRPPQQRNRDPRRVCVRAAISVSCANAEKMSDKRSSAVPDGPTKLDDDLCNYEQRTDSGFLSGENITDSCELKSEDRDEGNRDDKQGDYMHLDSGVDICLSETLSSLSLKHPELNDLSGKETVKPAPEPSWEQHYEQDEDGDTQLHLAIMERFPEVSLALIRVASHPGFLDTRNDDRQTPLHLAVGTAQAKVARWLVVAGAKPGMRDIHGNSPMHIAASTGDLDCCRAITEEVTQKEVHDLALGYPQQPYQRFDMEQWNYDGQTCVHLAAVNGHVDVLRYLVANGADINAREGTCGLSALHIAIARQDEQMIAFLLGECRKLDLEVITYGGRTVLEMDRLSPRLRNELLRRGAPTPIMSEDSDEEYDDDDEDEDEMMHDNMSVFVPKLVNASA